MKEGVKEHLSYLLTKDQKQDKELSAQSRNKDGYNIEVGCIDEVHEMTDSKVYDAINKVNQLRLNR